MIKANSKKSYRGINNLILNKLLSIITWKDLGKSYWSKVSSEGKQIICVNSSSEVVGVLGVGGGDTPDVYCSIRIYSTSLTDLFSFKPQFLPIIFNLKPWGCAMWVLNFIFLFSNFFSLPERIGHRWPAVPAVNTCEYTVVYTYYTIYIMCNNHRPYSHLKLYS